MTTRRFRVDQFDRPRWSPYDLDGMKAAVEAEGFQVRSVHIAEETLSVVRFEIIERCPCRAESVDWDIAFISIDKTPGYLDEIVPKVAAFFRRHRCADDIRARILAAAPATTSGLVLLMREAAILAEIEAHCR